MNCPGCGRPIEFEEKFAKVVSCPYCNSVLEFGGSELTKVGEQGEFIEFPSIFKVGKEVEWEGKKVYVKGQLRYEYDGGFFDEFYVKIDNKEYYIHEDDGQIKLLEAEKQSVKTSNSLLGIEVGKTVALLGKKIFVQESGLFSLVSMKGFVNDKLIPGKKYEYLDGICDGKMVYLEKEEGGDRLFVRYEV